MTETTSNPSKKTDKKENMLINMLLNIVIPTAILIKLSSEAYLGPKWSIVVALAFPIAYGCTDFIVRSKINIFSGLGIIGILLTGGISLLELDPAYIAIKEAAIPAIIGLATLFSLRTRYPLIKTFLYNDKILQVDKIASSLKENGSEIAFEKCLVTATYMVAGSFFLSSVLNYILAKVILLSPPGTPEYTAELGKMMGLSFPVIALPSTIVLMAALFYLFRRIGQLTQLSLEDMINEP
tara:strand:- start:3514 stop:4230 length:717 start_codon:yes stop_codon:yes gene_type:complete